LKFQALKGLKFQDLEGLKFQNKQTQKQMTQTLAPAFCSILGAENRQMLDLKPFQWEMRDDT
jgi:hypothetical protein